MKHLFLLAGACLFLSMSVDGQKAPMKFGKVSREELAETHYKADSTIDAAILCEYGVFDPYTFDFTHSTRFKIYSKEGLNQLIMSIPVSSRDAVRGRVYNLVDGKVKSSKMKRESIYVERVLGRYSRVRIAPPEAKAGSVIEISYILQGLPGEWKFQRAIPVNWSELRIPYTEYVSFNKRFLGYHPLAISDGQRWVAKDVPPFLPEPHINSAENYMTAMIIEVSSIQLPPSGSSSGYYREYSETWNDVWELFYKDDEFGDIARMPCMFLSDAAEEIKSRAQSDREKVEMALAHIRKEVKWNEVEDMFSSTYLRGIYLDEKIGTSADMNFLFINLLRRLDVEVYPMVISLRSEGYVNPHFPSYSRFNYTVAYVKLGDRYYPVDASDKYYPFDMLNPRCLNTNGFVIFDDHGQWVDVLPEKESQKMVSCIFNIEEDGFVSGEMSIRHSDYAAAGFRKTMEYYTTEDEYLESFEQSHPGIFITEYELEGKEESFGMVNQKFQVEIDGMADASGGMIQIDPIIIDKLEENPFKLEKRDYPVDFNYFRKRMFLMNIAIPPGYAIEQLPAPIRLMTKDKGAEFTYNVAQSGSQLQLMMQFAINKQVFLQDDYDELRTFYSYVVNKQAESIILKRAEP